MACKNNETKSKTLLFVSSFTDNKPGEGIHIYEFNDETGEATLKFTLEWSTSFHVSS
ncbi:hypothetical protein GCM10023314_18610 [Algibacter agarivorans]|uniref:Lipoprotein n=1 Tax=Algibacter agarivorans TaxID=1109741 RepID=A0ABP9GNF9_9FLAO